MEAVDRLDDAEHREGHDEEVQDRLNKIAVGDLGLAQGEGPVSYTHLDVYKRQVLQHEEQAGEADGDAHAGQLLVGVIPVSYTHLDVYKRQV